ncbi:MAG: LysR family transcriptional regulator [Clostridia bacterium]|nr:LysR family transcriptional regulator [Clostridia bacterium]
MFRYMEYVYSVYKAGSFSAAAENLFVSQPCLSAMVKKAEDEIGVPIFNRKTKPLSLTEYGAQYISYIERIYDIESELEQYLNDVRSLRTGKLNVGANNIFASYVLPGLIHKFTQLYPGVQIQMIEGNITYLEKALTSGAIDLILDNCPMDSSVFHQHVLGTEHLLLAIHNSFFQESSSFPSPLSCSDILKKKHLLSNACSISIRDFAHLPFIALREGNDTRYRMDALFDSANETPNIQLEVDQLATAYNIACNKLGATLVSDTLICEGQPNNEMCFYKLDDTTATRAIYLYYKHSRYVSLAMQKFINVADDFFSEKNSN